MEVFDIKLTIHLRTDLVEIRKHGADRPYCYINRTTGDIYRAGKTKPRTERGTRGNIFDGVHPLNYMTEKGTMDKQGGMPKGHKVSGIHPRAKKLIYAYIPGFKWPRVFCPRKRYRYKMVLRPVIRVAYHQSRITLRFLNPEFLLD